MKKELIQSMLLRLNSLKDNQCTNSSYILKIQFSYDQNKRIKHLHKKAPVGIHSQAVA